MCAKSLQLCPSFWDPMNYSQLGSSAHEISRQEYWSELPSPPPGDLPGGGIEPTSLMSSVSAGRFFTASTTWEAVYIYILFFFKVYLIGG